MLFGAVFWSVYADRCGRRRAFLASLCFTFVAGLASAFSRSFTVLALLRMAVGFGVGGNIPVSSALLTEFLPTKQRAMMLCYLSGAFWGIGQMLAALLGLVLSHIAGMG